MLTWKTLHISNCSELQFFSWSKTGVLRKFSLTTYYTYAKITISVNDDVQFLDTFHLKFTIINNNIVYILDEPKFCMFILCPNHHGQYF